MRGLGDRLLGYAGRFSFEQRIFHFAMLLGIVMTAFGTVMDIYYKANVAVDLAFVGCWAITYYLSRFRNHFHVVSIVSSGVFVFVFIPFNWISSGGSNSILPYYTILFIAVICMMLNGWLRIAMASSIIVVELLLIARDAWLAGSFWSAFQSNLHPLDFSIHLCAILAAMAVSIIVYSNTYMKEKARSEEYSRTIEEHYRQQIYYMENLEEMILKLKSERHDFNNHLGVIYGLLESGDESRARSYAGQLVKTARDYQSIVNIPYPMVRAMLNYKLSAAREAGLELRLDISVPQGLALDEFDATVILGNLLDNATEACAAVEPEGRYFSLAMQYKPDYLVIQTENPMTPGHEGGRGRSTKPDACEHGFGLNNIEFLAAKHNGFMEISHGDGVFRVNVALLVHLQD